MKTSFNELAKIANERKGGSSKPSFYHLMGGTQWTAEKVQEVFGAEFVPVLVATAGRGSKNIQNCWGVFVGKKFVAFRVYMANMQELPEHDTNGGYIHLIVKKADVLKFGKNSHIDFTKNTSLVVANFNTLTEVKNFFEKGEEL